MHVHYIANCHRSGLTSSEETLSSQLIINPASWLLCFISLPNIIYRLIKQLGTGEFGEIYQGEWAAPRSERIVDVAVKTLKEGASEQDKIKFLQEAAIIGQFSHPNIVKLYGMVTEGEPVSVLAHI